jgi:hypothetical protein
MRYQTTIDTVAIQIDLRDSNTRDKILQDILSLLRINNIYITHNDYPINVAHSNFMIREYQAVANNVVVASVRAGSYSYKDTNTKISITTYYVAIEFAGLIRYNNQLDRLANDTLLLVCAYLNTRHITFKITGMDIALDLFTDYSKILALCTKKAPKTAYCTANETQVYSTTSYIEKIPLDKQDKVVQKAYLYDKAVKENLSYKLTRFEVKLQSSFFATNRLNLWTSILNALSKYHVMYVPKLKEKQRLMDDYDACSVLRNRDIKRIGFDNYRCYYDMAAITGFINQLYTVKEIERK